MKKHFYAILFVLLGGTLLAQAPDKAKIDQYFSTIEAANKFMGNIEFSQDGKPQYTRSVGYLDIENKIRVNNETKFRIGSISKMFTSVLIFKAIEEKKLTLTDKLENWFPAIPNASKITLAHMLSHRSGIHNFTNDAVYETYMTQPKSQSEMVSIIAAPKSDFEPDSKSEYSNSNFVLMTFILEKTFKKTYAELVRERITEPLGLKNTYYGGKISTANNESYSYRYLGKWEKQPETDMSIPAGAGAIVSNVSDLSRFIEALFAGKLVSPTSLESMKTIRDGYGMGMFEVKLDGKTGYGHNGGIDGFTSMLAYFPESKSTLAFTSNGRSIKSSEMTTRIANWYNNKPFEIPVYKTYAYKSEELDPYLGVYASPDMPLKITITKKDNILWTQATGQEAFPVEATDKHIFAFDNAGIVLEFNPAEKKMVLKQGGGVFNFTQE